MIMIMISSIYHYKLSTSVPHSQRNVFVSELVRPLPLTH